MKIIDKKGLTGFTEYMLNFMFYSGILIILSLPLTVKMYLSEDYPNYNTSLYIYFLILLFLSGVCGVFIVNELKNIIKTINNKDPFVLKNVVSLKKMAIAAFIITGLFISKIIYANTIMTVATAITFFTMGIFSIILSEVFKQAVIYKEDNDFTI